MLLICWQPPQYPVITKLSQWQHFPFSTITLLWRWFTSCLMHHEAAMCWHREDHGWLHMLNTFTSSTVWVDDMRSAHSQVAESSHRWASSAMEMELHFSCKGVTSRNITIALHALNQLCLRDVKKSAPQCFRCAFSHSYQCISAK